MDEIRKNKYVFIISENKPPNKQTNMKNIMQK